MEPIYLALLFIAIIAIGEVISIKSRARIPTLLVVVATVFVLLQTGILPESYIAASTFVAVGGVLVPVLIVHLGTMIPLKTMYKQYQAVLITLIGLTFSVVGVLTLVTLFFNYETAVAGAGPITGGIIAYIVTSEVERGRLYSHNRCSNCRLYDSELYRHAADVDLSFTLCKENSDR